MNDEHICINQTIYIPNEDYITLPYCLYKKKIAKTVYCVYIYEKYIWLMLHEEIRCNVFRIILFIE